MADPFSKERWPVIRELAFSIGAKERQVQKWRDRKKVSGDWAVRLLVASRKRGDLLSDQEALSMTKRRAA